MDESLPVIIVSPGTNPEQACEAFFYGDYHYCGDAGIDMVYCCPGGPQ
jgi:hypothetical protein